MTTGNANFVKTEQHTMNITLKFSVRKISNRTLVLLWVSHRCLLQGQCSLRLQHQRPTTSGFVTVGNLRGSAVRERIWLEEKSCRGDGVWKKTDNIQHWMEQNAVYVSEEHEISFCLVCHISSQSMDFQSLWLMKISTNTNSNSEREAHIFQLGF